MKPILSRALAILCSALLAAQPYSYAQQPAPSGAPTTTGAPAQGAGPMNPQQLDSLVAPIALFPDPILSQVLVASTYPLEIVEAERWVAQNPGLKGQQLTAAAAKQPWDASVQALVAMPDLLKKLSQDVGWTSDLGNAFLAQQQDVMSAIQRMRQKAYASGALKSTAQQTVAATTEAGQNIITVQPADPNYVYLPVYDPYAVWGPPVYPYPPIYYGGGAAIAAGVVGFAAGIAIGSLWYGGWGGWGGWGWRAGWRGGNVIINNNFISRNNFNRGPVGAGNQWVHNPAHRGGVPYKNPAVANRFNAQKPGMGARPTAPQVQQRLGQAGQGMRPGQGVPGGAAGLRPGLGQGAGAIARPGQGNFGTRPGGVSTPNAGDRIGNRAIGGGMPNRAPGGRNFGGNGMNGMRGGMSRGGGGFHGGGGRRR
ncbi:MAG TPA: DUF3300 domain-containing protein [Bryobacteraceae bacterium]|nr:DUF3300 domain-containing protein [Bryobacteraceae bacterium]